MYSGNIKKIIKRTEKLRFNRRIHVDFTFSFFFQYVDFEYAEGNKLATVK